MPKNRIVNIIGAIVSRAGGFVLWFLIIILGLTLARNVAKVKEVGRVVSAEQAKLDKIRADNAALEAQIAQTQSAAFIEKEVRNKLGLAKEGEAVVILPDEETLRKLAPIMPEEEDSLPDPVWKRWLKLFI